MRVITGTARGRRLITREGEDVRPTSDRVKEAAFSIIQFEVEGRRFLDLFAGSGQMGIEALSRGAKSAVFVDQSAQSVDVVRRNLQTVGFTERAQVFTSGYESFLSATPGRFDLAFLDPPYEKGFVEKALPLLAPNMNPGGVILCEHSEREEPPAEIGGGFARTRTYRYGKVRLSVYRGGAQE